MKPGLVKTIIYGCVTVWGLVAIVAGITSESEFAIQRVGAFTCPAGTTPDHTTFQQSVTDSSGHTTQDTAWILQCKDASGAVVEEDGNYMLPWIGGIVGAAAILTLPVLLAVLIVLLVSRNKKKQPSQPGMP